MKGGCVDHVGFIYDDCCFCWWLVAVVGGVVGARVFIEEFGDCVCWYFCFGF